ncbi:MAG: recombination protein RecR [Nitrospinae bacterium]|nr:recombination protein RecR [Nitrospinota bacterium]
MYRPPSLVHLIEALTRLPGVGPKTAQRLAFHLLKVPKREAEDLAHAILVLKEKAGYCSICSSITETDPCFICSDSSRDRELICVVEEPSDVLAIEKTGGFKGRYHVLRGCLSPLEGVGPEDLRVKELLSRLREGEVKEVILATNPNLEGEATAMYLLKLIRPLGIKVTRLARGLPVGGDLEFADEMTLTKSLEGRREMG